MSYEGLRPLELIVLSTQGLILRTLIILKDGVKSNFLIFYFFTGYYLFSGSIGAKWLLRSFVFLVNLHLSLPSVEILWGILHNHQLQF